MNETSLLTEKNEYETISYLAFNVESADHMKEIRCDIRVGDIPRTMHGSLLLDIKCKLDCFYSQFIRLEEY